MRDFGNRAGRRRNSATGCGGQVTTFDLRRRRWCATSIDKARGALLRTLANYGEGAARIARLWPERRIEGVNRLLVRRLLGFRAWMQAGSASTDGSTSC
jgi:hypothetical protein